MFWSVLIALYVVRLIVTYFIMRKVYSYKPNLIGLDDVFLCAVPLLGLMGACYYLYQLPRTKHEKHILNKFFKVKQKKF